MKKVLVVAAHPDDEVLGCGGTIARLAKEGSRIYTLILGQGAASRHVTEEDEGIMQEIAELKEQAEKADKLLGVKKIFFFDFPDNRFDTVALLDIVKTIEAVKNEIKPDGILTHYAKDLNIDHQIAYQAVITAARPLENETVKEIYSFETPSSTEWSYPNSFTPDIFFDISNVLDVKLKALKRYTAEMRRYPHPRSLEGVELAARAWGMKVGVNYAEAFKAVRIIK